MFAELIKPVLEIVSSYLKIRAADAFYDLTRKIESDVEKMEGELNQLRDLGDAASQLRADLLRKRILRAQGIASALPTSSAPSQGGADGHNG